GHFAARRQNAAVEAGDLDGRRTLRHFQRLDRRQVGADPDDHADRADHRPQAEHRAPIDHAAKQAAPVVPGFLAALLLFFARGRLLVFLVLVVVVGPPLAHGPLRLALGAGSADAVGDRQAQVRERAGEAESWFLPRRVVSPPPEHTPT